jgi:carbamate kinase
VNANAPPNLIVLALGGNSLIRDEAHCTIADQWALTRETCLHVARIIEAGYKVVITHGNGPQVGFILRRSELARHELHEVPLDLCVADTQGSIGYMIQQSLSNAFRQRAINRMVVTVATQVVVAEDSPAFIHPSKPVGSAMDEVTACEHAARHGWSIAKTRDHVWQRVVPSPEPIEIVELDAIRHLLDDGYVVTAVGGGGIPVVRDRSGNLSGVEAVIDKDLASVLLAQQLNAHVFIISTAVRKVCLNFGKPNQRELDSMTLGEAQRYLANGQFGAGTMAPKISAIVRFLEAGGRKALVTCPSDLEDALAGAAGTTIVR